MQTFTFLLELKLKGNISIEVKYIEYSINKMITRQRDCGTQAVRP